MIKSRVRERVVAAVIAAIASLTPAVHAQEGKVDEDAEPKAMEWLHVTAGLGYKRVLLRTFFAEDSDTERLTADIVPEDMSGPAASLGVFTKLWFIGLGVNARVADLSGAAAERGTSDMTLWSFDAEMTFRASQGDFEPYILFAGGYSTFGGLDDLADGLERGLDVDGFNVRSGIGLDYYLHRNFSLRVLAAGDLLFLARKGVPVSDLAEPEEVGTINEAEARLLEADGSSAGLAYDISIGMGVHF